MAETLTVLLQVEDALLRLKRQLALQPPLLDKAIEEVQQLRPLAAQALLELTSTLSKQVDTWELIRLKPELVIYEKETKELKQEIDHLRGLITESESRKAHVQQALKRAKVRNGQLLVEMQDLREQLEIQRSREQANDIAVSSTRINLEQDVAAARQQADQNTTTHEVLAESDQDRRQLSRFGNDADLGERLEETQRLLEDARDRATDAEMECDSLRKQLEEERSKPTSPKNASGNGADGNDADLAQRLEETQRLLEDARDRATDAEMECDSLRKQLEEERSKPTSPKNASGNGADGNDADLAERLEETQRLLEDARDRATDAEMECDSLRKQLEEERSKPTSPKNASGNGADGNDADLAERLEETQRLLEDARDRATDAEMECDSLRKQLEEERSKPTSPKNASGSGADGNDADLAERLEETQRLLEDARDRATDAEMECDSLRKQLEEERSKPTSPKNASGNGADGNDADLAERLEETQRLLEDARDRATDAEMECDSLRKQLEEERSKPTSPKNASGNGADGNDADLAERLEETQRLLEDARDRATDAEMECDSLRKQLEEERSKPTSPKNASGNGADGNDADLAERLEETQRLLEDARDRATDAEMECDSLRKQLEEERSKPTCPKNASGNGADGNDADLAERLEETQRLLEDARDRATDAEMECDSLRKQLEEERSKPTCPKNASGNGADSNDADLAERLEETQRLLEDARDRATDLEMECELLRNTRKEEQAEFWASQLDFGMYSG